METKKYFLHADLDAFFASVEFLDHPEWKGKPVIVGGLPEDKRSVVSTASYEARKYGVHSAMPTVQAVRLCPGGIFVRPRMKRYHEKSAEVMAIFREFSPDVQQISVDEAFIDLTGTELLFGPPEKTAERIKSLVFEKTHLTVSVGLASSKYFAKLASEKNKPDGFYFIPHGSEMDFILNLPLSKVWGVGGKTLEKLKTAGIFTTKQLSEKNLMYLEKVFGNSSGKFLYSVSHGMEAESFSAKTKSHSISTEKTFAEDLTSEFAIETVLLELCYTVMFRMLNENGHSYTAGIKIRYNDFRTVSVQETSSSEISSVEDMFEKIKRLFRKKYEKGTGIRLLGVSLQNIEKTGVFQKDMFNTENERRRKVETAILNAKKKNPKINIVKARFLDTEEDS